MGLELPLALPLIFAGIRTATVYIIATATLAAVAGTGGGLGDIIVDQASYRAEGVLAAALCVTVLAFAGRRSACGTPVVPNSGALQGSYGRKGRGTRRLRGGGGVTDPRFGRQGRTPALTEGDPKCVGSGTGGACC